MALFPLIAMGQGYSTSSKKPFWADGYSRELNNSYLEVVSAFGYDLDGAKEKAMKEVIKRRSLTTGAEAKVSINNGNLSVVSDHNLIVKARVIDEYVHHTTNGYTVYQLVQTAKNPSYQYESVSISNEYSAGLRAFVPGMAQIYKGSKVKGYGIITAEAAAIAGIILCESERSNYSSKMKSQPKFTKEYKTKSDNWETGRNICIGVAAGIYLYNIIDAFVAKGSPRIVVKNADGRGLSVRPTASPYGTGVSLAYSF